MKVLSYKLYAQALVSATVMFALFATSFLFLEPTVGRAASSTFTVSQTITAELSIAVASSSLTMNGSLAGGITGGTSNGETDVVVTTNNAAGYNMTIQFSSSTAMYLAGGGVGSDSIKNYAATSVADRTFVGQAYAQFAFSAYSATDASDIDATFLDDGATTCGAGSLSTNQTCWLAPSSTAAEIIVNRTNATLSTGATTTVQFRVNLPSNPNPAVPTGIYTATATLTAVTN